eukprot:1161198-Pelagomonas_calceolata.AAC.8
MQLQQEWMLQEQSSACGRSWCGKSVDAAAAGVDAAGARKRLWQGLVWQKCRCSRGRSGSGKRQSTVWRDRFGVGCTVMNSLQGMEEDSRGRNPLQEEEWMELEELIHSNFLGVDVECECSGGPACRACLCRCANVMTKWTTMHLEWPVAQHRAHGVIAALNMWVWGRAVPACNRYTWDLALSKVVWLLGLLDVPAKA